MSPNRLFVVVLLSPLVAGAAFIGIRSIVTERDDSPSTDDLHTGHDCGEPVERYDEETLHRAFEMTLRMSEPDASPMWNDEQLRLSLEDPQFVAELERHFCEMEALVDE